MHVILCTLIQKKLENFCLIIIPRFKINGYSIEFRTGGAFLWTTLKGQLISMAFYQEMTLRKKRKIKLCT